MRVTLTLSILFLAFLTAQSCRDGAPEPSLEDRQTAVVAALDALVAELVAERPADAATYTRRLQAYLDTYPAFYGSAVVLLDEDGTITGSPYVYRIADGYNTIDLGTPSYNIEGQDWFKVPLQANTGTWTAPYYDEGGGEAWMITRSVPARDDKGIFAVVTTDLVVDPPVKE